MDNLAAMKNGWRHASASERVEFLDFVQEGAEEEDTAEGIAREWSDPEPEPIRPARQPGARTSPRDFWG